MHTQRVTVSFIGIWGIVCCLVFGGFAVPALAKNIVVTTLEDRADPPFDADSPCGTGTISDLYRADGDGLVSLREAIIAANNTSGADTITFATGGTIAVSSPLPVLCGGQTRINGDRDGDGAPDITLEGEALSFPAAGIGIISSHNTINGLQVQHFPFGIVMQAGGDFPLPGAARTVEHNTVMNNVMAESSFYGTLLLTGDVPGSVLAHTTITQNRAVQNGLFGIVVVANLSGGGSDTQILHTRLTDNEVRENGFFGIYLLSLGDGNVLSDATLARNTVSGNGVGIMIQGGFGGADENTFEADITDNTVTENVSAGIEVVGGFENSSNNHVSALIRGNTVERGHRNQGIGAIAGIGAVSSETGTSNNNVLDVRIEQNTVQNQTGEGMYIAAGEGSPDGRPGAFANGNQARVLVEHNTVENNPAKGIEVDAGSTGLASANVLEVRVAHNTVCNNTDTAILGEGGFSGDALFPANTGTGNVLAGEISKNTATVVVQDGTPGNTADVTQFNNDPCP